MLSYMTTHFFWWEHVKQVTSPSNILRTVRLVITIDDRQFWRKVDGRFCQVPFSFTTSLSGNIGLWYFRKNLREDESFVNSPTFLAICFHLPFIVFSTLSFFLFEINLAWP